MYVCMYMFINSLVYSLGVEIDLVFTCGPRITCFFV